MHLTQRLEALPEKPIRLWLVLWAGVMCLYLPAWKGGFQQDFVGWLMMYQDLPFWDMLNRKGAGIHSFYQLTQLQLYIWTWLFGTHQLPWFLLFTALHAFNGVLLFRLCRGILTDLRLPAAGRVSLAGSLIFLAHPSLTEVVIWKACYHYLIALQIVLWILLWTYRLLHTREPRWALYALGLFLLSTATLEIWYTIPGMVLVLGLAYRRGRLISPSAFRQLLTTVFLPMIAIFGGYLLLYHHVYGVWVAHGAYELSGPATLKILAGRIWSYEAHLFLGMRFWTHLSRQWFYQTIEEGSFGWIVMIAGLAGFALYAWLRYPKAGPALKAAGLLTAWSLIALVIVLHFGPERLFYVSNDRYLYYTAAYQCMLVSVLIGRLLPARKRIWTGAIACLLLLCVAGTSFLVLTWRRATKVFWGIQYNFRWDDAPLVLLLNIPSSYSGIGIIHSNSRDELREHVRIFYGRVPKAKIVDVASYNMLHAHDGAHVRVLDSMRIMVTLNQTGSWWWFHGLGLLEYGNEYYDLKYADDGMSYILSLKQRPPGMVILYAQGMQWREVDMGKRVEQW